VAQWFQWLGGSVESGLRDSGIRGNVRRPTGDRRLLQSETIRWIRWIRHRKPAPDHNLSVARANLLIMLFIYLAMLVNV